MSRSQQGDLGALLAQALESLTPEHREVILLDHAGFRYAEIAGILEVETGTVKSRLSRARAAMRDILTGLGYERTEAEPPEPGGRSESHPRSEPARSIPDAPQAPSAADL
jgi:hypothetical protein